MNSDSSSGAGVRRLRDRLRENTAQEILSAAEQVFVQHGIHNAHMADIAAAAGVAVGTLYNHYQDREALMLALAQLRREQLLLLVDESLEHSDGQPFRTQLRRMWQIVFSHWEKHWQFFSVFMQAESAPPAMAQSSLAIQRAMYQRWEILVERGRKQRVLRPKVAKLAPTLLMGITRSLLMRRLFCPSDESPLAQVDTLVDFFLNGAGAKTK